MAESLTNFCVMFQFHLLKRSLFLPFKTILPETRQLSRATPSMLAVISTENSAILFIHLLGGKWTLANASLQTQLYRNS